MDEIQTNQRACVAAKLATLKRGDVQSQKKDDRQNCLSSIDDAATLRNGDNQHTKEDTSFEASSQNDAATLLNDRSGDQNEPHLKTAEVIAKGNCGAGCTNCGRKRKDQ